MKRLIEANRSNKKPTAVVLTAFRNTTNARRSEAIVARRHQLAPLVCTAALICGCQLVKQVERNTSAIQENQEAIEKTTRSIRTNAGAVDQSTAQIELNSEAVRKASEAILANGTIVKASTLSIKENQLAAIESTNAISENQNAIVSNTRAIIENERIVRETTAAIQQNGEKLQELDALMDRLAKHKTLVLILSLAAAVVIVAPYIAVWITVARLHRLTKSWIRSENLR
jgi:hypothetical protein